MTIKNSEQFDMLCKSMFRLNSFGHTVDSETNRIRFDLGGDNYEDKKKAAHVYDRAVAIFNSLFSKGSLWLRLIVWHELDNITVENKSVISHYLKFKDIQEHFIDKDQSDNVNVLYLHIPYYSEGKVSFVLKSIINWEIGGTCWPDINIGCYFCDFEREILVNVYDDRGLDVVSPSLDIIAKLYAEFPEWINQHPNAINIEAAE